jgi:hypothetical protein
VQEPKATGLLDVNMGHQAQHANTHTLRVKNYGVDHDIHHT